MPSTFLVLLLLFISKIVWVWLSHLCKRNELKFLLSSYLAYFKMHCYPLCSIHYASNCRIMIIQGFLNRCADVLFPHSSFLLFSFLTNFGLTLWVDNATTLSSFYGHVHCLHLSGSYVYQNKGLKESTLFANSRARDSNLRWWSDGEKIVSSRGGVREKLLNKGGITGGNKSWVVIFTS